MKLISLNVEGERHYSTVLEFLDKEQPYVICLQEAAENYMSLLKDIGYTCEFLPRVRKKQEGNEFIDGSIIATKQPQTAEPYYYYEPQKELAFEQFDEQSERLKCKQGVLLSSLQIDNVDFHIATTHFTWTPQGEKPNQAQIEDMTAMLQITSELPPHILCGDFNIPRDHSPLYKQLLTQYSDNIPTEYTSSLDKNLHQLGDDPTLTHLFTDFMVDYVFSQKPYKVSDVRLEFGVSDHAAVVAEINKS